MEINLVDVDVGKKGAFKNTLSCSRMVRQPRILRRLIYAEKYDRPKKRSECVDGVRPCPYVGCPYHLYLDVNPENGSIRFADPTRDLEDFEETCALDVAEYGGSTLVYIGRLLGITRERVRQIEEIALEKIRGLNGQVINFS